MLDTELAIANTISDEIGTLRIVIDYIKTKGDFSFPINSFNYDNMGFSMGDISLSLKPLLPDLEARLDILQAKFNLL